jgi:hypothetical protein
MTEISAAQLIERDVPAEFVAHISALRLHCVSLAIGPDELCVFFESTEWSTVFAERYADQLIEPTGRALRHYVVRDDTGYVFWSPGERAWAWEYGPLPDAAVVFLADAAAMTTLFNASTTLVSFHAAAVGIGGIAAAISGDSNAGKTTTALACGRAGLRLYSDERCVITGRTVVPFQRSLNVRSDGWSRLESRNGGFAPLPRAARPTHDGFSIRISELFGRIEPTARPELRAVFILSGSADRARVMPVGWHDVASALAKWMNSADRGLDRGARIIKILRDVVCFRLELGTPNESAELIASTLTKILDQRAS